jgi:hypothetical protein
MTSNTPRFADRASWFAAKTQAAMTAATRPPRPTATTPAPDDAYPADWDTSPVDANDERGDRAGRISAPRRPSGAGVDYPADWAR